MSFASLAGAAVRAARVHLPSAGVWWAEVDLAAGAGLAGRVALVIGGLTLSGTIQRGGVHQGTGSYRLIGGAGGWRREVPARAYRNDAGVKLTTVVGDAAREVGETLEIGGDRLVGTAWVRRRGPASEVLARLVGSAWHVGADGITRIAPRVVGAVVGAQYDVLQHRPELGLTTLATEAPEAIAVGAVLTRGVPSPVTIRSVNLDLSPGALRLHVWGTAA